MSDGAERKGERGNRPQRQRVVGHEVERQQQRPEPVGSHHQLPEAEPPLHRSGEQRAHDAAHSSDPVDQADGRWPSMEPGGDDDHEQHRPKIDEHANAAEERDEAQHWMSPQPEQPLANLRPEVARRLGSRLLECRLDEQQRDHRDDVGNGVDQEGQRARDSEENAAEEGAERVRRVIRHFLQRRRHLQLLLCHHAR